ncbi:FERM and PDZ domain-containing protein 1 isoform X1 [Crotalus tigris]|uniref:FERM and PDZ domain-containing protein 1 isoform X1 n=2 Tax=Crotalus tigris TaxID=88082 RepID=UPI00192F7637|nr:FERM and PDZ domain-containing protein 1 isoform X1 [Crotalus tigris]XP_039200769.1 FERM and PDZ domain-containing protein 1 isoform X1 [Crotalus tigris]XP_039200770.1 FERM and PDZ domain-containing protein 1 isoform X1 [Crotalus tigris]
MEDLETRKARRIERMVAKWLRRSRINLGRGRTSLSDGSKQPASHVKLTVEVQKDVLLGHYGIEVSHNFPLFITSVAAGSTADGKLLPGDHIFAINNNAAEELTGVQAAALLRESQGTLQFTVLRCISGGPKSSFLTAEKRARLKTNPVKVHFAEEVAVNGHNQGSSLLCMPNVLKVYLENGQTKAFKFEANTTVKDIILTLKEKLSIQSIEHFALVLEEQHNILKMGLLHDDELIERVVQRNESHAYRCLFRVCFIPKDPLHLLQQDPVAFEYLYLQSCSDVLQERFAVEMKCSVALRLAALHMQERMITCAQPQKVSLKYIKKDWGIENFISPTLLRNMRGKDIKKAISVHMKRNHLLLDPRQKNLLSAAQVQLCYLQILGDLKLYGGKIFNATLMLQDRETCIVLLVGAKYGISHVLNTKLSSVNVLAEFASISRLELIKESDKVSMVKIYLQDIKVLTLLLESNCAKDLACLISGYYRMFVDSSSSIFIWEERKPRMHRISAEEGYESRTCSDSEESSEPDSSLDRFSDTHSPRYSSISPPIEEKGEEQELEQEKKTPEAKEMSFCNGYNINDSLSEASDSANTESRGLKSSGSSDSLDALEEDDLEACSASRPEIFQFCNSALQKLAYNDKMLFGADGDEESRTSQESFFPFLLPPLLSSPGLPQPEEESRKEIGVSILESKLAKSNVMEYYSLCANLSPASSGGKNTQSCSPESCSLQEPEDHEKISEGQTPVFVLTSPSGFEKTNSDDNFCCATERMTPTEPQPGSEILPLPRSPGLPSCSSLDENILSKQSRRMKPRPEKAPTCANNLRKRRSFLETNYTSQVSFPKALPYASETDVCYNRDATVSGASAAESLLKEPQQISSLLEATQKIQVVQNSTSSSDATEMGQNSSGPNAVLCLASAQASGGSLDLSNYSLNSFSMPPHQSHHLSTPGIAFHQEDLDPTCKGKAEKLTEIARGVQGHCEVKADCSVKQALDKKPSTIKAMPPAGVSYVLIEEIIHTTTKPSVSQNSIQDKPLSFAPEKDEKQEQVVLDPCKRDSVLCESSQALGDLKLEEGISQLSNKGDEKHLGVSNVTELFFNCSDTSGQICWPNFSSAAENAQICQQADKECQGITSQNGLGVNNLSLKDGVINQVPAHLSAMNMSHNLCPSTDVAGDYKTEGKNLMGDALITDYKNKRYSLLMASSENTEQSETNNSAGQSYPSFDRPSEGNCTSDLSFLSSDKATEGAVAFSDTGPPGLVNSEETSTPQYKPERCSCQLSYASCFHGVENEAELDCTKPFASSISEGPLTTPPSTRHPLPSDFNPTRRLQEHTYTNGAPRDSQNHRYLPELPIKTLSYMKEKWSVSPFDFCHLLGDVVELQEVLKWPSGNQRKHPEDQCAALFSENKNALYAESQRLLSNCQKIIKAPGPSPETQMIVQKTFQNLLQLTEVCLQFTDCGLCSNGHIDLKTNLGDVLCSYQQFLEACRQTHEKDYSSLSLKLCVCQHTALTASLFCLVQQFIASSCT